MYISPTMDVYRLMEMAGSDCSYDEAAILRDLLNASGYDDTDDIGQEEWYTLLEEAQQ